MRRASFELWESPQTAYIHTHITHTTHDAHTYMHTYICIHTCTHIHTHACTSMHACMHIHMYMHTHSHTSMHICMCIRTYTFMHTHIHVYNTCMHMYIHACTHTHMHTHTHVQNLRHTHQVQESLEQCPNKHFNISLAYTPATTKCHWATGPFQETFLGTGEHLDTSIWHSLLNIRITRPHVADWREADKCQWQASALLEPLVTNKAMTATPSQTEDTWQLNLLPGQHALSWSLREW